MAFNPNNKNQPGDKSNQGDRSGGFGGGQNKTPGQQQGGRPGGSGGTQKKGYDQGKI